MINKNELSRYLESGLSSREIEKITGIKYWNILYAIQKYNLEELNQYKKPKYNNVNYFNKIDNKNKSYILGFLLGDGCLSNENKIICNVAINDREVLEFIQSEINCNIVDNMNYNKKQRIYPNSRITIGNTKIVKDIKRLFGGRLKQERHIPIISKKIESYLLQGFFDAEGCITWGKRKDRNRVWQKISFTSQLKMLEGVQNILLKNNIATKIKPKKNENCYVMNICSPKSVLAFLDFVYQDNSFIILNRKYNKANALRLELGEFGET